LRNIDKYRYYRDFGKSFLTLSGNNDNPTTRQFDAAYKSTLSLQRDLTAPTSGNCSALDETTGIATQNPEEKRLNLMPILAYQCEEEFEYEDFEEEDEEADLGLIQENVTIPTSVEL
jgi:hypothetical protein